MLKPEDNERLARVGRGTPAGELLRRYWYPLGTQDELPNRKTKRVKLLGEDLVLYRDSDGNLGLVGEFCPHRRASLAYGIPERGGIRCPYHGWKFDGSGACTDQPNEPAASTFKEKVGVDGYLTAEFGGLIWGYLGPLPAPLLPRLDGFCAEPAIRMFGHAVVPCNWLQIMENSCDPVHAEWLHGHFQEFVEEQRDGKRPNLAVSRHHLKIAFDEFEFGLYKRRLCEGQSEDADDWKIGHPIFFPNTLAVGTKRDGSHTYAFQIRVPMDDVTTMHYWYTAYSIDAAVEIPPALLGSVARYEVPFRTPDGFLVDYLDGQDIMVWTMQGPIARRDLERLGTTDRGVLLWRRMLEREIARVESGADPMAVIRDPAKNGIIDLHVEFEKGMHGDGIYGRLSRAQYRYSPIFDQVIGLLTAAQQAVRERKTAVPA